MDMFSGPAFPAPRCWKLCRNDEELESSVVAGLCPALDGAKPRHHIRTNIKEEGVIENDTLLPAFVDDRLAASVEAGC